MVNKRTCVRYMTGWPIMLIAVIGYGTIASLQVFLVQLGEENLLPDGENPISSCSILVMGNVMSGLAYLILFRKQMEFVRKVTWKHVLGMFFCTFLYIVLGSYLSFEAYLRTESVIQILLLNRLEPLVTLLLTRLCYKAEISTIQRNSSILTVCGILTAIVIIPLAEGTFVIEFAALLAMGSVLATSINNATAKKIIADVPVGVFLVFRSFCGAFLFFWYAVWLFDYAHFAHIFDPFILQWMAIHAVLLYGGCNILWWTGLKAVSPPIISLIGSAYLPIALFMAYLILGAVPSTSEIVGGGFVLLSIFYSQVAARRQSEQKELDPIMLECPTGDSAFGAGDKVSLQNGLLTEWTVMTTQAYLDDAIVVEYFPH